MIGKSKTLSEEISSLEGRSGIINKVDELGQIVHEWGLQYPIITRVMQGETTFEEEASNLDSMKLGLEYLGFARFRDEWDESNNRIISEVESRLVGVTTIRKWERWYLKPYEPRIFVHIFLGIVTGAAVLMMAGLVSTIIVYEVAQSMGYSISDCKWVIFLVTGMATIITAVLATIHSERDTAESVNQYREEFVDEAINHARCLDNTLALLKKEENR